MSTFIPRPTVDPRLPREVRAFEEHQSIELYRSPDANPPHDVIPLNLEAREWSEAEQIAFAEKAVALNCDTHNAKAAAAAAGALPPPVGALDVAAARATLRAAIQDYAQKHELAKRADEAVDRANDKVAECDGQLEDYKSLDARITAFHADAIRRGTNDALPCDLERQQAERGRIIDRLCAVRHAADLLKREAKAAHDLVGAADVKRSVAAVAVISAEMDKLAESLAAIEARAQELREALSTAAATWLPIPNRKTVPALSSKASNILTAASPPLVSDPEFAAAIRNYHSRLTNDSEAQLEADDVNDAAA